MLATVLLTLGLTAAALAQDPETDDTDTVDETETDDETEAVDETYEDEPIDEEPVEKQVPRGWILDLNGEHRGESTTAFVMSAGGLGSPYYLGLTSIEAIPLAPTGFSRELNDAFFLEIDIGFGIAPKLGRFPSNLVSDLLVGFRYQLYVFPWLNPYIAARGGVLITFGQQIGLKPRGAGAVGTFFNIGEKFAIRLETGFPHVLVAGFKLEL